MGTATRGLVSVSIRRWTIAALWDQAQHQCSVSDNKVTKCHTASLSSRHRENPRCLVGSLSLFPFVAWLIKHSQSRAAQSNFPAQHNPRRPFTFWPEEGNCIPLLALTVLPVPATCAHVHPTPIHPCYQPGFVIRQAWPLKEETAPGFQPGLC